MMVQPENEIGVIALFSMGCELHGWDLEKIGSFFPDAIVKHTKTGKQYRAEFEFNSSSFITHGHDPSGCDLIICWKNDLNGFEFPILEIQNWSEEGIFDLSAPERKVAQLFVHNRKLQSKINELTSRIDGLEKEIGEREAPSYRCQECYYIAKSRPALNAHSRVHRNKDGVK